MGPDLKETFDYGLALDKSGETHLGPNLMPSIPRFKEVADEYLTQGYSLSRVILSLIALGLGLEESAFDPFFTSPLAIQRLIRYPPQASVVMQQGAPVSIGAGSHVDFGAVTLLQQDLPGLEVWVDNTWRTVFCHPEHLVLNTGFLLEKLTNGLLKATHHRVVNRCPSDRYSTALFLDPHPEAKIVPLPALIREGEVAKFEACISGHKGIRFQAGYNSKPA